MKVNREFAAEVLVILFRIQGLLQYHKTSLFSEGFSYDYPQCLKFNSNVASNTEPGHILSYPCILLFANDGTILKYSLGASDTS